MGENSRNVAQMKSFREVVDSMELSYLGFNGPYFTWCNGRADQECIFERLD